MTRPTPLTRRHRHLREDHAMYRFDFDLRHEEHRLRTLRDRAQLLLHVRHARDGSAERAVRRRFGRSLIRLGQRLAGDPAGAPAWSA